MDEITMWLSMRSIVANNRIPFSSNQGFELDAEFDHPTPFPDVIMTIAVLAFAWIEID